MTLRQPKPPTVVTSAPLIALAKVTFQMGDWRIFSRVTWRWNPGEQWAILGPNGSGKSLFIQAIQGRLSKVSGEVEYNLSALPGNGSGTDYDLAPEAAIVEVSPSRQRELARQESSFYQARWHSGEGEGSRTVGEFLSQDSVENILPCEVNARRSDPKAFASARSKYLKWLKLLPLVRRKMTYLSNGEQRKILLVRALLGSPRILILDDPYGGLDASTRELLRQAIQRLMRAGTYVFIAVSRPEEIPTGTTHILLVDRQQIVAQGTKQEVLSHELTRRWFGTEPTKASTESGLSDQSVKPMVKRRRSIAKPPIIEMENVRIEARGKTILKNISWVVRAGERWALSGPNGAGKTTLLSLIQGDHPQVYAQNIRLFGERAASTQSLWETRMRIGWMSPELNLHYPADWPCLEVVCSGFYNSLGLYHGCSTARRTTARRWLKQMGLSRVEKKAFGELSTGVQRMVLLCRAVVKRPRLLILDEPCQGVDSDHSKTILRAIDRLVEQTETTLLFVTHHRGELPRCITHTMELRQGKITSAP